MSFQSNEDFERETELTRVRARLVVAEEAVQTLTIELARAKFDHGLHSRTCSRSRANLIGCAAEARERLERIRTTLGGSAYERHPLASE